MRNITDTYVVAYFHGECFAKLEFFVLFFENCQPFFLHPGMSSRQRGSKLTTRPQPPGQGLRPTGPLSAARSGRRPGPASVGRVPRLRRQQHDGGRFARPEWSRHASRRRWLSTSSERVRRRRKSEEKTACEEREAFRIASSFFFIIFVQAKLFFLLIATCDWIIRSRDSSCLYLPFFFPLGPTNRPIFL